MKKTRFYSMLMAFAMILSVGLFAACGSDDPDPTPTPSKKATSCTLYYVVGLTNETFGWVDSKYSLVKEGEAENYQAITTDGCTNFDGLPSSVAPVVRLALGNYAIHFAQAYYKVVPITVSSFPTSFTATLQHNLRSDYVRASNPSMGRVYMFVAVDNLGNIINMLNMSASATYMSGVSDGKEQNYLDRLNTRSSISVTVRNINGEISLY